MKTLFLAPVLFLLLNAVSLAQISPDSIPGEYHLEGVMETASAILLKPDSTFEIFFSYGAMDRQGSGKWGFKNGKVVLNSRTKPGDDFALVSSKVSEDSFTTVKIVAVNEQVLPFFEALIKTADGEKYGKMNQEGVYRIPKVKSNNIELFFTLTPERFSSFTVKPEDNYFEFRPEPWITEIFAEEIILTLHEEGLSGEHPLLKGDNFSFTKMK